MEYIVVGIIVFLAIGFFFRPRSCTADGCGHNQQGNDGKCAICRYPMY